MSYEEFLKALDDELECFGTPTNGTPEDILIAAKERIRAAHHNREIEAKRQSEWDKQKNEMQEKVFTAQSDAARETRHRMRLEKENDALSDRLDAEIAQVKELLYRVHQLEAPTLRLVETA